MKTVFVVDADATGLSNDLNDISTRENHAIRFSSLLTPEQMFDELGRSSTPDLIMLHHHWPGLTIAQLLQRVGSACPDTRVIVFTGQSIDVQELIECVRFGVADYWPERGTLDPVVVFRKIFLYCSDSSWTMRRLLMPSGSVQQLLQAAETALTERDTLKSSDVVLRAKLRSAENKQEQLIQLSALSTIKLLLNVIILTVAFVTVITLTSIPIWGALSFVAVIATFCLLLEGKITEAAVKWRGGSWKVKGK